MDTRTDDHSLEALRATSSLDGANAAWLEALYESWLRDPGFETTFKSELAAPGPAGLPLHDALTQGSHVLDEGIEVMVFRVAESPERIEVKAGIHFNSVLVGCACEDDPTPVSELTEYCVVQVEIDRRTGEAQISLLPD